MKRLHFLFFIILFSNFNSFALEQQDSLIAPGPDSFAVTKDATEAKLDSICDLLNRIITNSYLDSSRDQWKIYPTENTHISILLNTGTGEMALIQWSLKSKEEFIATLNPKKLSIFNTANTFELYPTSNMYQFLLLDKTFGRVWHVQWGTKREERWIREID